MEQVWSDVGELFDLRPDDDPNDDVELWLDDLSPEGLISAFQVLWDLPRAGTWGKAWLDDEWRELTHDELGDCPRLVGAGHASSAHVVLEGVDVAHLRVPFLRFFVTRNSLQFHWWPAADGWSREGVYAFLVLLARLRAVAPNAALVMDPRWDTESRASWGRRLERASAAVADSEQQDARGLVAEALDVRAAQASRLREASASERIERLHALCSALTAFATASDS